MTLHYFFFNMLYKETDVRGRGRDRRITLVSTGIANFNILLCKMIGLSWVPVVWISVVVIWTRFSAFRNDSEVSLNSSFCIMKFHFCSVVSLQLSSLPSLCVFSKLRSCTSRRCGLALLWCASLLCCKMHVHVFLRKSLESKCWNDEAEELHTCINCMIRCIAVYSSSSVRVEKKTP